MKSDLLILSATELEASHFLNLFPYRRHKIIKPGLKLFSGQLNENKYDLLITGPGVFNTSHALSVYLQKAAPYQIVQMGIAGLFEQTGLGIGDIAIATHSRYIHSGIGMDTVIKDPLPFDLIKDKPSTRNGIYPSESTRIESCTKKLLNGLKTSQIQVTKGPIITVSSITSSKVDADTLYKAYSPVMQAMEGAASAHIASLYDIPLVEIRSASNFVGERDKAKWNLELAIKNLAIGMGCL